MDVSTVDGATSKLIGEQIKSTGALFLEVHFPVHTHFITQLTYRGCAAIYANRSWFSQAPVSGSKKPAEDGQLIFLTAG